MISPKYFYDLLTHKNIRFFTGVPDSLLKSFCAYVTDNTSNENNIIAANEGNAIGIASGVYTATNQIPLVYLQNSGQGNIINPILSMADKELFSIPILLLIGWRGEPNIKDEPQHIKQGRVTLNILDSIEIKYEILSTDESKVKIQLEDAYKYMVVNKAPFAFIVRKNTFSDYTLQNKTHDLFNGIREEFIKQIIKTIDIDSLVVSTTGMISRELYEIRESYKQQHNKDLLVVGAMGHASSIALGIAANTNKQIYCFDGDGAVLMHMGSLAVVGSIKPRNLCHIVLNNGAHDSVGGQPTFAMNIDLCEIAKACKYEFITRIDKIEDIETAIENAKNKCSFIEIMIKKGNRNNLGRPIETPLDNIKAFMNNFI